MSTSSGGINPFHLPAYGVLAAVSSCCPPPNGSFSCITHPSATILHFSKLPWSTVQLACVKHAASVRPEPGSNSQIISYSGVAALPLSSTYNSVKVRGAESPDTRPAPECLKIIPEDGVPVNAYNKTSQMAIKFTNNRFCFTISL